MSNTTVKPNQGTATKGTPIRVSRADLPLSCPRPDDEVWNMHPRVYLPIEKGGEATCPYCGAHYVLAD
ncbi:MAG: zinc-finger domain-containing protein [Chromatiaceae bacterium]|nr:zinc-finger domain-containing protein [Gammaproteobacteria bacterium]MCP5300225.1 zinc-finger domain-containing protein [Chromatiaceae bacterium]MCP5422297.1 zinc-finger domain-containing protein [Chromatiaceae bacterium]